MATGISRPARDLYSSALHAAVVASVTKVNGHADHQPDDQTHPCFPGKIRHEVAGDQNSHNRHKWHHWSPERALKVGIAAADNPYARADDHESQKRSDIDHVA